MQITTMHPKEQGLSIPLIALSHNHTSPDSDHEPAAEATYGHAPPTCGRGLLDETRRCPTWTNHSKKTDPRCAQPQRCGQASSEEQHPPCKVIPCTLPVHTKISHAARTAWDTQQQLRLLLHTRTAVQGQRAVLVVKLSLLTTGPPAEATATSSYVPRPVMDTTSSIPRPQPPNRHTCEGGTWLQQVCGALAWPCSCTNSPISVTRKQERQLRPIKYNLDGPRVAVPDTRFRTHCC